MLMCTQFHFSFHIFCYKNAICIVFLFVRSLSLLSRRRDSIASANDGIYEVFLRAMNHIHLSQKLCKLLNSHFDVPYSIFAEFDRWRILLSFCFKCWNSLKKKNFTIYQCPDLTMHNAHTILFIVIIYTEIWLFNCLNEVDNNEKIKKTTRTCMKCIVMQCKL